MEDLGIPLGVKKVSNRPKAKIQTGKKIVCDMVVGTYLVHYIFERVGTVNCKTNE